MRMISQERTPENRGKQKPARCLSFRCCGVFIALLCLTATFRASASEIVDVLPLTNRILMVHFQDGHVVHHKKGQKRTDEQVVAKPLDLEQAVLRANYRLSS